MSVRYTAILAHCNWTVATLYAFTRLGVADVLSGGPSEGMSVQEIAAKVMGCTRVVGPAPALGWV